MRVKQSFDKLRLLLGKKNPVSAALLNSQYFTLGKVPLTALTEKLETTEYSFILVLYHCHSEKLHRFWKCPSG